MGDIAAAVHDAAVAPLPKEPACARRWLKCGSTSEVTDGPRRVIALALPVVTIGALVFVFGRGNLAMPSVRWGPLAVLALGGQLLLFNPPLDSQAWAVSWGPWLYLASLVGVLGVLLRNSFSDSRVHIRAAWLAGAVGVALNITVIVFNGGYMPQERAALASIGASPRSADRLTNVAPLTDQTRLAWLGDIIAQPDWLPLRNVVSIGDLLLSMGVACALAANARRQARVEQR